MNKTTMPRRQNRAGAILAVLTLLTMTAPGLLAKDKPSNYDTQRVSVIAHLPLPGASVNQMFVQEQGNKQYLYIQQASQPGYTIVDVTKPSKPKVVKHEAFPNNGSGERVQMVSGGIALAETPESSGTGNTVHELTPAKAQGTVGGGRAPQSVRVLDMSDPANPRTLQTFEGVTSVLADDSRSLIYIANRDGVWVLRHRVPRPPLPQCDSESAFSPIADCQ